MPNELKIQLNTILVSVLVSLLLITAGPGCADSKQVSSSQPGTPTENIGDEGNHQATFVSEAIEEPQNPDGDAEIACKSLMMRTVVQKASSFYWELMVDGEGPDSYESLLEKGTLPIIFANRYTGEDIKITADYSPGDMYLNFPTAEDPVYRFMDHYGDKDLAYDPSVAVPGEKHPLQGMDDYSTDGRILYLDVEVSPEEMAITSSTSACRARYDIPAEDEARARVLVVFDAMDEIMRSAADWITEPPVTIDGYIDLAGRRNPVAWVNPYTGQPMQEVGWVNVPCYQQGALYAGPVPDFGGSVEDIEASALAGNYSYAFDTEKDYAQFYFEQPDGSTGAYLIVSNRS